MLFVRAIFMAHNAISFAMGVGLPEAEKVRFSVSFPRSARRATRAVNTAVVAEALERRLLMAALPKFPRFIGPLPQEAGDLDMQYVQKPGWNHRPATADSPGPIAPQPVGTSFLGISS